MSKDITPYNKKGQRHGYWEVYHDHGGGSLYFRGSYANDKAQGYFEIYGGYISDSEYVKNKLYQKEFDLI